MHLFQAIVLSHVKKTQIIQVPIFCWILVSEGVKTSSTVGLSVVSSFSVAEGNKSPIDEKIVDKLILMESLRELPPPTVSVMYLQ